MDDLTHCTAWDESSKINCPAHGIHEHYIESTIPGHEGHWCMICQLEKLGPTVPLVTTND